jgi:riboflavin biosynthesis pyrimidine reductase
VVRLVIPPASLADHGAPGAPAVTPPTEPSADLDDAQLAELYRFPPGRRWVRTNFIATVDGAAEGPDHRSGSMSGAADRRILALLRALSDVILVGAGTARMEGYAPADIRPAFARFRSEAGQPPTPPIAVITDSLTFPEKLLDDPRTVVITSSRSDAGRRRELADRVDVVVAGSSHRVDAKTAIDALSARGHQRILCEGGPTIFGFLAGAGVVDELCLTISPELLSGTSPRIMHGLDLPHPAQLRLDGLLEADGFLFFRWLLDR